MVEEVSVFWCSSIVVSIAKSMEGGVGMVCTVCRAVVPHKASKRIRVLSKSIPRDLSWMYIRRRCVLKWKGWVRQR